jgi:hypothetical protein
VAPRVGGPAQRDDQDVEAASLEGRDLLRDEGFRKARITFQDERNFQINRFE